MLDTHEPNITPFYILIVSATLFICSTAAAVAYRILKRDEDKTVLVFDLGGGTFDVSLININHGVVQVLATSGDTQLGGEDFTQRVMNFLIKIHMKNTGVDIRFESFQNIFMI